MGLLDIDSKKVVTDEFFNNKKEWVHGWTGFGGGLHASKGTDRFYYKKVRLFVSIEIPSNAYPKESNVHKLQFGTIVFRYNAHSYNLRIYFLDYPASILNFYSNNVSSINYNYALASYNKIIEDTIGPYKSDYYVDDELDFDTIVEGLEMTLNKYFEIQ